MLRFRQRTARRDEFLSFVSEHSDAAANVHVVNPRTGDEITLYRSRTGHVLGEAIYPAGSRATYRIKTAHALVLALLGSLACGPTRAATLPADPFPIATVAAEVENHALSVGPLGHPPRCLALVSTRDDGSVFVTLATVEGRPLTFPHGPYPSETVGMIDVLGAYGRDC